MPSKVNVWKSQGSIAAKLNKCNEGEALQKPYCIWVQHSFGICRGLNKAYCCVFK